MKLSGVLDIVNSIVAFQLVFFTVYLFIKGRKIPSTDILKVHLICQFMVFTTYPYWRSDDNFLKYFFVLSQPALFLLSPTFLFYVRSRLYRNFRLTLKHLLHCIPSLITLVIIIPALISPGDFHSRIQDIGHGIYIPVKIQFLIYNSFTLYLVYKYEKELKLITSESEKQKLSWLYLITYGILITSLMDFILFLIPPFTDRGLGFLVFFVFINIFFFKSIIQPDQFLGVDENKPAPLKITPEKSQNSFDRIEEVLNDRRLYLEPDLNLHNVAQAVKLSDRLVSQVIRQKTSMNFNDYINSKRIDYAKDVLQKTTKAEKNVLEILYEAGFNSKSVFNTQFRKVTGMSPTEFRENSNRLE